MQIFLFLKTFAFFDMFFFSFLYIHSATWDTFAILLPWYMTYIEIMTIVMNDPRCCGGAYCSDIQLVNGLWVGDLPHLRRLKLLICISL